MPTDSLSEQMARELEQQSSNQNTMQVAVNAAVRAIHGSEAAVLSMALRRRVMHTLATTCDEVRLADELQSELGEGPCLDAVWDDRVVHCPVIARETRWPRWAFRATQETGYRSMMAFQLFRTEEAVGVLGVYSTKERGFAAADWDDGLALAAHISVAVRSAQEVANLQSALDSRTVIAQAVVILMERYAMTPEAAFSVLSRVSRTTITELRDVATQLCALGRLPGSASHRSSDRAGSAVRLW